MNIIWFCYIKNFIFNLFLQALHALRPQQLTTEVLSSGQAIFQVFYFNKDGSSE